jgi:ATP-dependent Lon protease
MPPYLLLFFILECYSGGWHFRNGVVYHCYENITDHSHCSVRNLEREIGSVCRAKAVEYAEAKDSGHTGMNPTA